MHAGQLADCFIVETGVRQGCLLSPFLFLLATDWIMKKTKTNRGSGIQLTPWSQLEDLDFADDLALLSHSHQQMQGKNRAAKHSVNTARTQLQQKQDNNYEIQNTKNNIPITLKREPLAETSSFTYLGSTINKNGGTEGDVKAIIQKARVAFII